MNSDIKERGKNTIDKYILGWAELVDTGEVFALEMIKNVQPEASAIAIFKKALAEQSRLHHQANIEIFSKLNKYAQSSNYKNS